ncbi:siderophore-interacting protein [uncultured Serinicoccus sp.]|uniref:siderophore-interacting protein n=1 Tax=uncultured Serinicoccus sp. TaxID=735514 RepID=UPI00261ABC6B|nr:siderophore-interacting protein [uncultured Serinicoccus sp.]
MPDPVSLARGRQLHPLHVRHAVVREVTPLGGRMRRVTLRLGPETPPVPWVRLAVGDHVKVAFPHPTTGELTLPTVVDDRPHLPEGVEQPVARDYTVRAVDDGPDGQDLALDFVVHGSGPASTWARDASPGDTVGLLGPRGSMTEPSGAARYLCLGDETAIPALGRWLEEAPATAPLEVVVQVPGPESVIDLPARDGATVTWLVGTGESDLADHLHGLDPPPGPGDYVWAAGEARAMVAVRRAAREHGIGADGESALHVDGYWRRGVAGRDHHAPLED